MRAPSTPGRRDAVAALAAGVAGCLWLAVWAHQRIAHGPTEVNEMRIVSGLTWMDSAKALAIVPILLVPATRVLQEAAGGSRIARAGWFVAVASLLGYAVGAAVEFWAYPWGSYARTAEAMGPIVTGGGILQALSALGMAVGFALLAWPLARRGLKGLALLLVLVAGAVASFFPTPAAMLPGLAWLAFAFWIAAGWLAAPGKAHVPLSR